MSVAGDIIIPSSKESSRVLDKVLYQGILEELNKQQGQTFTKGEAESLTELSLYLYADERLNNKKVPVKTFKGIHYLKNLERLTVNGYMLTKIKGMEPLPKLKYLNLKYNKLKDVKFVKNFKNLEDLDLTENHVASLAGIGKLKN